MRGKTACEACCRRVALGFFLCMSLARAVAQVPDAPAPEPSHGQVIFSRSAASAADTTGSTSAEVAPAALAYSVTDAMRTAPTFTSYDFTIHLEPARAGLEAELRARLRNDGPQPLRTLPLQLSSTLHFEHIRSAGKVLPFAVHTIASDADHTGSLTEAAISLPAPLAPGEEEEFTIEYSGTMAPSSGRLDRVGAPALPAAQTDWDRIGEGFTGLRGFGDSVWYPVASVPALLGDGARLFQEIGRQKLRNGAAQVSMAITAEFMGDNPNIAVLDGHPVAPGEPAALPTASFPGIEHITLPATPLGFATPSLMLATREEAELNALVSIAAMPGHDEAAQKYRAAADLLQPLFSDWFAPAPARPLLLLDLPVTGAAPADDGDALLLSLNADRGASALAGELSGALAHVYFHSPRPWLREGVAGLMSVLWTERTEGRSRALEQLGAGRSALALAEPATPGSAEGQSLIAAQDAVFYRTKGTFVLWMLRSLAGDAALVKALRAYDPAKDTKADYFEGLVEHALKTAETAAPASDAAIGEKSVAAADLHWFFQAWVYDDPGLPDLAITKVFSNKTDPNGDQWLVAVQVSNSGYADAEVPLTVHSASSTSTEQVRVPARGSLSRRMLLLGQPTEVDVNDGSVPEIAASVHRRTLE